MAITGEAITITSQPPQLQPQQPSILPNYPQLIMSAIEMLNEPKGSNKSSISRHIESTLPTLPASHTTLLAHHLNAMKANGQLVFLNNNYMRPDPNAPPRRGRGRPAKPKDPLAPSSAAAAGPPSSPRPRGRPPKDPNAPPPAPRQPNTAAASGNKRKRGRPAKKVKAATATSTSTEGGDGVRRGRGRPPKAKPPVEAVAG